MRAGGGVRVRPARDDEAALLSAMARDAKASWGYPAEWVEAWADDLRLDAIRIDAGGVFVAEDDEGPVGWTAVGIGPHGPEIEHLWVDPRAQGRGVGRQLASAARAEGVRRGWGVLRVESDPHAAGFYEAVGGRVVGRRPAPMDGRERWLPVLELHTDPARDEAARLVALSEVDDRMAVARGRARKRLIVAGGMTLVGPVNFMAQAFVHWESGWPRLGLVVVGILTVVTVGLWLQWFEARGDVRDLGEDRCRLLEGSTHG